MKYHLFLVALVLSFFSGFACKPKVQDNITPPDYSKWSKPYSVDIGVVHNGNRTGLLHEIYYQGDSEGKVEFVMIIHNENREIWLMVYDREDRNLDQNSLSYDRQVFEQRDGKWGFAGAFYNVEKPEIYQEFLNFMKEKYQLELTN